MQLCLFNCLSRERPSQAPNSFRGILSGPRGDVRRGPGPPASRSDPTWSAGQVPQHKIQELTLTIQAVHVNYAAFASQMKLLSSSFWTRQPPRHKNLMSS